MAHKAVPVQRVHLARHLPGPDDGHADALAVVSHSGLNQLSGHTPLASPINHPREPRLDRMAKRVRVPIERRVESRHPRRKPARPHTWRAHSKRSARYFSNGSS